MKQNSLFLLQTYQAEGLKLSRIHISFKHPCTDVLIFLGRCVWDLAVAAVMVRQGWWRDVISFIRLTHITGKNRQGLGHSFSLRYLKGWLCLSTVFSSGRYCFTSAFESCTLQLLVICWLSICSCNQSLCGYFQHLPVQFSSLRSLTKTNALSFSRRPHL